MPTEHNATAQEDLLYSALVGLTGRRLSLSEVQDAVGLGSSQYAELRKTGRLVTPDRLFLAADHFSLNPVEVLVACRLISARDASDFVDSRRQEAAEMLGMEPPRGARLSRSNMRSDGPTL